MNYALPSYGGKKVMIYHNITPPRFYRCLDRDMEQNVRMGYEGIRFLADKVEYAIADSDYNRQELRRMGYRCPIDVCPILIPFSDYDWEPNEAFLQKYRDGKKNWLFVGRIAPNKKPEDVIRAFAVYHREYEPESRLLLIGSMGGIQRYDEALENYIRSLRLEKAVVMPGHVSFAEILAGYHAADVFVCMSEHEGFCVPLLEAMYFGVPIVAYASSAVPETLGKGGLLLREKDPELTAAAVNRVLTDEGLREALVRAGKERLKDFSYETVKTQFLACLKKVTEE
jgi:glycosyltransferase involved in cell wall biosynthesis